MSNSHTQPNPRNSLRQRFVTAMRQRSQVVLLIVMAVWAVIQLTRGNWIYSLLLIGLYFMALLYRRHLFRLLAISVLALVLWETPVVNTVGQIRQAALDALAQPAVSLMEIFTPNFGLYVLPRQVQHSLELLTANEVEDFRLSDGLANNLLYYQRINESAWPKKMALDSQYLLIALDEIFPNFPCTIIEQKKDVALAYCP